jgi:hypothetical protein
MIKIFRYVFIILILGATADHTLLAIEVEQPLPPQVIEAKIRYQSQPEYSKILGASGKDVSLKEMVLGKYSDEFSGSVTQSEQFLKVNLIYGWTETWALGATIPWEQKKQSTSLTFSGVNQTAELKSVEKNIASDSQSGLGDVALWMRYNLSSSYRWLWTISPKLVFPTGVTGKARGFKPVAIGDGQMDFGLKLQSQWYPPQTERVLQIASIAGLNQLKGERENLAGEKVTYQPGNSFDIRYGWILEVESFVLGAEFSWFIQAPDALGSESGKTRRLYQWNFELGYGNLTLLEQNPLPIPFQVRFGVLRPFIGENVPKESQYYLSGDIYF